MARRAKTDRFGNTYELVSCKANRNGYPVGYVEIKGQLYKVEPSPASNGKEDRRGREIMYWVKVTKVEKRRSGGSL